MSLWFAGYPKTPGFDVRFGSQTEFEWPLSVVRFTTQSGHPVLVAIWSLIA
jgi:hypothetical protein